MDISPIAFYSFAVLAIACALMVVFLKNPVASALNLVVVFFAFAGIYAVMGAHLVAALQILVYTGAVMVLFVFVIMLLNADEPSFDLGKTKPWVVGSIGLGSMTLFGVVVWAFKNSPIEVTRGRFSPEVIREAGGNTRVISELLFSEYILPFELTSVLLLAAIMGVVAIAMRQTKKKVVRSGDTGGVY